MNVVVIGGTSGIGLETVNQFVRKGANVVSVGRSKKSGKEPYGRIEADIADADQVKSVALELESKLGHVDILILNAGVLFCKPLADLSVDEIDRMVKVNYSSLIYIVKYFETILLKAKAAHVVTISSVGGVQGSVKFPGLAPYSSSKGGAAVLTECLAVEYAESNISFNCLALGAVNTAMLREAFPGYDAPIEAHEMAEYIVSFATDQHKFMNGKIVSLSTTTP